MENCAAWKSATARRFALNLVLIQAKAKEEVKGKTDRVCSAVDALVTEEQSTEPKPTSMGDTRNPRPKGKVSEIVRMKNQTSQNVPLGIIDLGSFEVLSDLGDEVDVDDSTYETTEMVPPLPPDSWFKRTETS